MKKLSPQLPQLIVIARENVGKSQLELAEDVGIEQGTLSKIENGLLAPSEGLIEIIANQVELPASFFYQEWNPIRVEGHYRRKISTSVKETKTALAKMTFAEKHFSLLCDAIISDPPEYPKWDVDFDGSPSLCAKFIREYYNLKGRIENITEFLESIGFIIIELDLGEVDGYGTVSANGYPIIFINKKCPGDRDNFSKAHELFHFIAHYGQKVSPDRDVDKEATEFASELLLPTDLIRPHLTKLSLTKLAELKSYWKVSMQAILVKAERIGGITKNQSTYLWKQLSAKGYRKNEPNPIPKNKPTLFLDLIQTYLDNFGYKEEELERVLRFPYAKIGEWYLNKPIRFKVLTTKINNAKMK